MKKKNLYIIAFLLLTLNIFFVFIILSRKDFNLKNDITFIPSEEIDLKPEKSIFYNQLCPDIDMLSADGKRIYLRDYSGNVILLRFSTFSKQDFANLLFLQHLKWRFQNHSLKVFIVRNLRRDGIYFKEYLPENITIVEDDGYISGIFNARVNDLVLIDKDFRIKLKHNQLSNRMIYYEINEFISQDQQEDRFNQLSLNEIDKLFEKTLCIQIQSGKQTELTNLFSRKIVLLNLFVSPCMSCPLGNRINALREISLSKDCVSSIILFGRGNRLPLIREFSEKNNLAGLEIAILQWEYETNKETYSKLFDFSKRSRLFIIKNGKVEFAENKMNSKYLDKKSILNIIND